MHLRHTVSARFVITIVAASLFAAACNESNLRPVSPTTITSAGSTFSLAIQPARLFRRSIVGAVCPFQQPFLIPFDLLLATTSGSPLFLHQVRMQFIDSFGVAGPRITLPQPDLMSRFGTIQLPPQGSRAFPFSFEFGCATRPVGTLSIFVETIGARQTFNTSAVTVAVR